MGAVLFTVRSSSWLGGLCVLNLLPYWKISLVVRMDSQITFVLLVLPHCNAKSLIVWGDKSLIVGVKEVTTWA